MSVPGANGPVRSCAGRRASFVAVFALLLAGFELAGCDTDLLADGPAETCKEVGAQCVLATGPLGVCERSTCTAGASEPCFACVSQH